MRSAVLNLTLIIPATACHQRNCVERYSRFMPLVFFLSPTDPRMRGTLERTMAELVSDSLVHRYEIGKGAGDGLTGSEGTFNMCTFWLVEALTRAGYVEEARYIFEKMLTYAIRRGIESYDRLVVRTLVQETTDAGYRLQALVQSIVKSVPFQQRRGEQKRVLQEAKRQ